MRIERVTINFTETCNLGDYSNTKPGIELTAALDATDDVHTVIDSLVAMAKGVLQPKVDEELEIVGRTPKYWPGPRFDVIHGSRTDLVAIVPAGVALALDGGYYTVAKGFRYQAALRRAGEEASGRDSLFNCSDGDFTHLVAYATARQQAIEEQEAERRRQQEEERRQREAAWAERQRQQSVDFDDDDDDVDDNE